MSLFDSKINKTWKKKSKKFKIKFPSYTTVAIAIFNCNPHCNYNNNNSDNTNLLFLNTGIIVLNSIPINHFLNIDGLIPKS